MNGYRFFWPMLIGFAVYSFLIFIWGETGLMAMQEQENLKYELEQNLHELNLIHLNLNSELQSLRGDEERIVVQSRNLGYIRDNEKMLFIDKSVFPYGYRDAGNVISLSENYSSPESLFRWAGILLFLFFGGIVYIAKGRPKLVHG